MLYREWEWPGSYSSRVPRIYMTPSTPYGVFTLFDGIMEANQNIAEWPCGQPHRWPSGGKSSHIGRLGNATQMRLSISSVYIIFKLLILVLSRILKKNLSNFLPLLQGESCRRRGGYLFRWDKNGLNNGRRNTFKETMVYGILELEVVSRGGTPYIPQSP